MGKLNQTLNSLYFTTRPTWACNSSRAPGTAPQSAQRGRSACTDRITDPPSKPARPGGLPVKTCAILLCAKSNTHSPTKYCLSMNYQATVEQLHQLRLDGMAHAYAATLQLPTQQQPHAHELLATLTEAETNHRQHQSFSSNIIKSLHGGGQSKGRCPGGASIHR